MKDFLIYPQAAMEVHGWEHVKNKPPIGDADTLDAAMRAAHAMGGGTIFPKEGANGTLEWKDLLRVVNPGTISAKVWGLEPDDEAGAKGEQE